MTRICFIVVISLLVACSTEESSSEKDSTVLSGDSVAADDATAPDSVEDTRAPFDVPPDCDPNVDADFDTYNECEDCNDFAGDIYPGATERCDGADQDCDGKIDEDFDLDLDGYAPCTPQPALFDCDDENPRINPGVLEICCNAVDEDCNGLAGQGCACCDRNDWDGDGVSACDADCEPEVASAHPGADEVCDGVDSDCNMLTRNNCALNEPCNADGDSDPDNDQDLCAADLQCLCSGGGCVCAP